MSYQQQKYSGVKRVFHDRKNGLTSYERIDRKQTKFDSTAEFKLYILLEEYFLPEEFEITCHPTVVVGDIDWSIDFKISTLNKDSDSSQWLASIINEIQGTNYQSLSCIFLEYKGIQDKNFIRKMSNVAIEAPRFSKGIVLVSEYVGAFGCYDKNNSRFYCHPILSMGILEKLLIKTLLNKD